MCPKASASQQLLRSVLRQKEKRSCLNLPSLLLSVAVSPVGNEVWYRYMGVLPAPVIAGILKISVPGCPTSGEKQRSSSV